MNAYRTACAEALACAEEVVPLSSPISTDTMHTMTSAKTRTKTGKVVRRLLTNRGWAAMVTRSSRSSKVRVYGIQDTGS